MKFLFRYKSHLLLSFLILWKPKSFSSVRQDKNSAESFYALELIKSDQRMVLAKQLVVLLAFLHKLYSFTAKEKTLLIDLLKQISTIKYSNLFFSVYIKELKIVTAIIYINLEILWRPRYNILTELRHSKTISLKLHSKTYFFGLYYYFISRLFLSEWMPSYYN